MTNAPTKILTLLVSCLLALATMPAYAADEASPAQERPMRFMSLAPYKSDTKTPLARSAPSKLKLATASGIRKPASRPVKLVQAPAPSAQPVKTEDDQQLLSIFAH